MRRAVLLLLLITAVAGFCAATASATYPGKNGFIVYANGKYMYSIDPEQGNHGATRGRVHYKVHGITDIADPSISPKGNKVAWYDDAYLDHNVYVTKLCDYDARSCKSKTKRVTKGSRSFSPVFSPNGKQIAYGCIYQSSTGKEGICRINADGSHKKVLSKCSCYSSAFQASGIDWSPNGKLIAFSDGLNIYTIPASGGHAKKILDPTKSGGEDGDYFDPHFSPNSQKILFTQEAGAVDNGFSIEIANADGSDRHVILGQIGDYPDLYYPRWATWSPNGQKVLLQLGSSYRDYNLYTAPRSQNDPNSTPLPSDYSAYTKLLPDGSDLGSTDNYSEVDWGPTP
jgi:Tol biopolymer transport system component